MGKIRVVLDGPPDHHSGRFVELEDEDGRSFNGGKWRQRRDGLWEVLISCDGPAVRRLSKAKTAARKKAGPPARRAAKKK